MTSIEADEVLTRDLSSGRVHKRYRIAGNLVVDERCNLDDADEYEVIESTQGVDADALCRRCFHEVAGAPV